MDYEKIKSDYEQKVKNISNILKKNYFMPVNIFNSNDFLKIKCFDDMFYEMYFKKKYFNEYNKKYLNIDYALSGNIFKIYLKI